MIKHQRNLPSPQTAARVITLSGISLKQPRNKSPSKATFIVAGGAFTMTRMHPICKLFCIHHWSPDGTHQKSGDFCWWKTAKRRIPSRHHWCRATKTAWWGPTVQPLWKIFLSVGMMIPNVWKNDPFMFQTTKQKIVQWLFKRYSPYFRNSKWSWSSTQVAGMTAGYCWDEGEPGA